MTKPQEIKYTLKYTPLICLWKPTESDWFSVRKIKLKYFIFQIYRNGFCNSHTRVIESQHKGKEEEIKQFSKNKLEQFFRFVLEFK